MIVYRRPAQLALQASLLLALEPPGAVRPVRDLAYELEVPATYLTKVLQLLTRVGLLQSVRGPGGGLQLARAAGEITLWEVLAAVEPLREFNHCALGLGDCNDLNPCPLHETWAPLRDRIVELLRSQNLQDIAQQALRGGLKLRKRAVQEVG